MVRNSGTFEFPNRRRLRTLPWTMGSRGTLRVSRKCQSQLALARIHDRPVLRSTVERCAGYSDDRRWGDMVKGVLRQHGCAFLDVMSAACGVCVT